RHTRLVSDWSSDVCSSDLTREVSIKRDGDRLPGIAGVPLAGERIGGETYDGEMEIALFPGDLLEDPEASFTIPDEGSEPALASEIGRASCRERREKAGGAG